MCSVNLFTVKCQLQLTFCTRLWTNSLSHLKFRHEWILWSSASLLGSWTFLYQVLNVQRQRITQESVKNNINPGINDYYDKDRNRRAATQSNMSLLWQGSFSGYQYKGKTGHKQTQHSVMPNVLFIVFSIIQHNGSFSVLCWYGTPMHCNLKKQ